MKPLRWGILGIFLFGYLLTFARFDEFTFEYLFYTLLSIVSCAILLLKMQRFDMSRAAVWLVLVVFLAVYYVKFYILAIDPEAFELVLPPSTWNAISSIDASIHGFFLATLSFCAFCITAFLCLSVVDYRSQGHKAASLSSRKETYALASKILLVLLLPVIGVSGYLASEYDIGQLGAAVDDPLPFHLGGALFYFRLIFIPGLLLLLVVCADRAGNIKMARIGVFLLLAYGVLDIVLRSSRSGLLVQLLSLVFLVMVGGFKPRRFDKRVIFSVLVVSALLTPLITEYRWLRLSGISSGDGFMPAFRGLLELDFNLWETLLKGMEFVFFRITGIEIVIAMLGLGTEPLGAQAVDVLSSFRGVAGYLTVDIFGYPADLPHTNAPGFVGWFYLVGGNAGIILGSVILGLFVTILWDTIGRMRLYSGPIFRTFVLLVLFFAITDGVLDSMLLQIFAIIVSIGCLELFMRCLGRFRA